MKIKNSVNVLIAWLLVHSAAAQAKALSPDEITLITQQIPHLIRENYVLKDKVDSIVTEFEAMVLSNKYLSVKHPEELAKTLTADLRNISNDKHLYVKYYASQETKNETDWTAWEQEEKRREINQNYGFTNVSILAGNVGYIKIVESMHPYRGMPTAVAAMSFVQNSQGLIIDIRGNGGGYGGLLDYLLNHYFAGAPTHISTTYYTEPNTLPTKQYTSDLVYGKLRVDTPLFIIIDEKTGSAAEFFAYTLQAFSKATIVGQRSAGAAHMNSFYTLNENFRLSVSTAAPINPITHSNWENTGVIPDYSIETNHVEETRLRVLKVLNKKASK